ncbi:hypothetical protein BV898_05875 [Hypsibius exemplaris]|uniref:Uncharacterized protein n=1 Tax=Hypsibius exemplaris TaxID=2072580 RepID=A0A1W0WY91_HYPEX|nr:hypothetical protein BV898_05875 [Hypsibius exemplaris]
MDEKDEPDHEQIVPSNSHQDLFGPEADMFSSQFPHDNPAYQDFFPGSQHPLPEFICDLTQQLASDFRPTSQPFAGSPISPPSLLPTRASSPPMFEDEDSTSPCTMTEELTDTGSNWDDIEDVIAALVADDLVQTKEQETSRLLANLSLYGADLTPDEFDEVQDILRKYA